MPPSTDFCANALELLGLAGGTLASCTPVLPDLYWVNATGPTGGVAGPVVVEDGRPVQARGCAVGAAWLKRIGVYTLDVPKPVYLVHGLEGVGALPEGFTSAHLSDRSDPDGVSRLTLAPFRLELIAPDPDPTGFGAGALEGTGGGGPGRSLPPQRRAVLTGDADYRFTWTVERRTAGGPWTPVSVTPCE